MKNLLPFIILFTFLSSTAHASKDTTQLGMNINSLTPKQSPWKGIMLDLGLVHLNNAPALMQTRMWRPASVNIYYYHRIELGSEKFTFNPGIGVGLDNFFFQDNVQISAWGDTVLALENYMTGMNVDYRKSKLSTNFVDIPFELRFKSSSINNKAFKIALGGKVGMRFQAQTKVKYDVGDRTVKEKVSHDHYVNRFRYGVTGRIGYGRFLFYGYYSLSDIFQSNTAPEMNPIMFGVSLSAF
ncbi:MAG: porin family protein [Cytophagaceae bacterium]